MLLVTGTVDLGSEDNSLEIKACAKKHLQNAEKTLMNEVLVLLKKHGPTCHVSCNCFHQFIYSAHNSA